MEKETKEYKFEDLLTDIQTDQVGTALYVSNLNAEQVKTLFSVIKATQKQTKLRQLTLLDCDQSKAGSFDSWCDDAMPFSAAYATAGFGDGHSVMTLKGGDRPEGLDKQTWIKHGREELLCTPLHKAILEKNTDEALQLLKSGASPNVPIKKKGFCFGVENYKYPLQVAVNNDDLKLVRELLMCGADPNLSIFFDGSAMDTALNRENSNMLHLFARAGCLIDCFLKCKGISLYLTETAFPFQTMMEDVFEKHVLTKDHFLWQRILLQS